MLSKMQTRHPPCVCHAADLSTRLVHMCRSGELVQQSLWVLAGPLVWVSFNPTKGTTGLLTLKVSPHNWSLVLGVIIGTLRKQTQTVR